ncbi:hypothetical protein B5M47_03805 [candidate division CPR3 bacterium 4484_211]|uniref:Methyltransferase type 11 domain-containing protein n=1 Tax=candidate division CPR3 bacterium 4484_211 TaxID=1968527 RepID=A0A1W9NWD5_UNCC3|nr:MAG: hypothetical protein B5M47_03805 [candidate division CPR3 bacterium 4484_211]
MTKPLTEIADYDLPDCDYIKYWQGRQYEHEAEKIALNKLLPNKGQKLVDLGGGYGRLTPTYHPHFEQVLIIDTSERSLNQARMMVESLKLKNIEIKKGDIYNLPLKSESFDTALMIRVMHHLRYPQRAFNETARILKPKGIFILEFPNKCHAKALIRASLKGRLKQFLSLEPYEQPAAGDEGIFLNFHFHHVRQLLQTSGFIIEKKISVSNFRSPTLKKILPNKLLLNLEKIGQVILTPFNFGPSIFIKCRKTT